MDAIAEGYLQGDSLTRSGEILQREAGHGDGRLEKPRVESTQLPLLLPDVQDCGCLELVAGSTFLIENAMVYLADIDIACVTRISMLGPNV